MSLRFEIRPPLWGRVYGLGFGLVWCGFLIAAIVATHSAVSVVPLAMLLFGLALVYRITRLRVIADDGGVHVRNLFRDCEFAWSQVEGFRVGSPAGAMPNLEKVIFMLTVDGAVTTLDVTRRPYFSHRARARLDGYVTTLRTFSAGA